VSLIEWLTHWVDEPDSEAKTFSRLTLASVTFVVIGGAIASLAFSPLWPFVIAPLGAILTVWLVWTLLP
jgi:hypothetical protein